MVQAVVPDFEVKRVAFSKLKLKGFGKEMISLLQEIKVSFMLVIFMGYRMARSKLI